jgi:hypothetical protein
MTRTSLLLRVLPIGMAVLCCSRGGSGGGARTARASDDGPRAAPAAALPATAGGGAAAGDSGSGAHYTCVHEIIDVSGSASPETCARWAAERERVLAEIRPGVSYVLSPLHGQSRVAAPFLHLEPPAPAGPSRMKAVAALREAALAREKARKAFVAACESRDPALARESDVFGALATAKPPACGHTLVVIWSDLIHERKGELDMTHDRLTDREMEAGFKRIALHQRWRTGLLAGVDVRAVVREPDRRRPSVNDPSVIQQFFKGIARSLGAETVEVQPYYAWGGRS